MPLWMRPFCIMSTLFFTFKGRIVICTSKFKNVIDTFTSSTTAWNHKHTGVFSYGSFQSLLFSRIVFVLISFSLSSSFIHKVIVCIMRLRLVLKGKRKRSLTATRENIASTQLAQPIRTNKQHCLNRSSAEGWWECATSTRSCYTQAHPLSPLSVSLTGTDIYNSFIEDWYKLYTTHQTLWVNHLQLCCWICILLCVDSTSKI